MADSSRVKVNNFIKTDKATLDKTHSGSGSETYSIDCTGHYTGMVIFDVPAGYSTGSFSIVEFPYEGAPLSHETTSSSTYSLVAGAQTGVRMHSINGAYIEINLTADAAVQVVAVTH